MRFFRPVSRLLLAAWCISVLAACGTTMSGRAVPATEDPFSVGGMEAVDGPTGLRTDARAETREVTDTDNGEIDTLAGQAVSDLEEFWQSAFPDTFGGDFKPVNELQSWDSDGRRATFCRDSTDGEVNAGFCTVDNSIGWDRGVLLPSLRRNYGDMAITMVLAHEYGHALQYQAQINPQGTPTLVREQQADCLAGTYMRWVAEGKSPRFILSTGDGLNNVLAAMLASRDPLRSESEPDDGSEHGSAFERISAFQFGFTDGAKACTGITLEEITKRRGELPVALPTDQNGEFPITEASVTQLVDTLNVLFSPKDPPALSFDAGSASGCPDARPSSPASYCPARNTITVDLPSLQKMGQHANVFDAPLTGDNTAYSTVISRYMTAMAHQRGGLTLDTAEAGLRTACLTGVASAKMTKPTSTPGGNTLALTAGDLDEAVSGLLTNGLVAGDVNGEPVPAGFSRIAAFQYGVLGDEDRCYQRFP